MKTYISLSMNDGLKMCAAPMNTKPGTYREQFSLQTKTSRRKKPKNLFPQKKQKFSSIAAAAAGAKKPLKNSALTATKMFWKSAEF